MSAETFALSIAAEPATVLYLITGGAGLLFTRIRKTKGLPPRPSVTLLFCKRTSRFMLESLHLL